MQRKSIEDLKESSLKIVSAIGKGTYGSESHKNDSNLEKVYLKKTSRLKHSENLERELKTMLHFHTNPFIVKAPCPHLHFETNTEGVTLCYIYMKYASLGNLDKMISDAGGRLPEHSVRRATRMILQGLKALHSEGYVHGDIKPSNVFVFPSNLPEEPWDIKLTAGFGLSKEPPTVDSRMLFPGTLEYMPPEATGVGPMLSNEPPTVDSRMLFPGPAWDIWSLRRTVLKMLGGTHEDMGSYFAWSTDGCCIITSPENDFWIRCCALRLTDRPTVDELLDHPFVAEKLPSFPEVSFNRKEPLYFPVSQDVYDDWSHRVTEITVWERLFMLI